MGTQREVDANNNIEKEKKLLDSIWIGYFAHYYTNYYNQLLEQVDTYDDKKPTEGFKKPAENTVSS